MIVEPGQSSAPKIFHDCVFPMYYWDTLNDMFKVAYTQLHFCCLATPFPVYQEGSRKGSPLFGNVPRKNNTNKPTGNDGGQCAHIPYQQKIARRSIFCNIVSRLSLIPSETGSLPRPTPLFLPFQILTTSPCLAGSRRDGSRRAVEDLRTV